jgi:hypothetical protein
MKAPPVSLLHDVIFLNHVIVFCFLVWVKVIVAPIGVLVFAFSRVCCCVASVLIAHGVSFFSLMRQKVSILSWKTLCTLRWKAQEVCNKDRSSC